MEGMKVSKLQFYSLGIVAVNKGLATDIIEVVPIEDTPMINGQLSDNVDKYKAGLQNSSNDTFSLELDTTVSVKAKWLPINNSNRVSSPDVRRGETVVIYRFADTDQYWWNTLFNDQKIRRLETVIYGFVNTNKEGVDTTSENSYWFEVSTHRKIVHLHTSKNDGEPFGYDIQINAKDGVVTITDDVGNFFELNSKDTKITLENVSGTIMSLDKANFNVICETMNVNASKQITFTTPVTSTSDKLVSVGRAVVGGSLSVTGASTMNGGASVAGDMKNNGVNIGSTHTHSGVQNGTGSTSTPN